MPTIPEYNSGLINLLDNLAAEYGIFDELEEYKGKWANLHIFNHKQKLGKVRYNTEQDARDKILKIHRDLENTYGTKWHQIAGYKFTIQIPVKG